MSNVKNEMSNVKYQMSIMLNFCRSRPPEFLRSFLTPDHCTFNWGLTLLKTFVLYRTIKLLIRGTHSQHLVMIRLIIRWCWRLQGLWRRRSSSGFWTSTYQQLTWKQVFDSQQDFLTGIPEETEGLLDISVISQPSERKLEQVLPPCILLSELNCYHFLCF